MAGNTFGKIYTLTSFGESHGPAVGGVIDGCPPGVSLDLDFIQRELDRRKPGQSKITTPRKEDDGIEILSGFFEGKTTGTPIGFLIRNKDQRSGDYGLIKETYRPSHADYTYDSKYGFRDYRGGGRSSARETIARVVAGAIAKLTLRKLGIEISGYTSQVHTVKVPVDYTALDFAKTESNIVRCPHTKTAELMISAIEEAKEAGDSLGGIVSCVVKNVPPGIGEPVFDKLHAELGKAMLSINAVKGFEYGSGFGAVNYRGSEHNDIFTSNENLISTKTNRSGGIQGGISNGEDIYFNVVFKPTATVMQKQETILKSGKSIVLEPKGRHDPCVVPRAVPIVENMAAMVVLDMVLRQNSQAQF